MVGFGPLSRRGFCTLSVLEESSALRFRLSILEDGEILGLEGGEGRSLDMGTLESLPNNLKRELH